MLSLGLFVRIEAKPGKEDEVAAFLMEGLQLPVRNQPLRCGSPCGSDRRRSPYSTHFSMNQEEKHISTDRSQKR